MLAVMMMMSLVAMKGVEDKDDGENSSCFFSLYVND